MIKVSAKLTGSWLVLDDLSWAGWLGRVPPNTALVFWQASPCLVIWASEQGSKRENRSTQDLWRPAQNWQTFFHCILLLKGFQFSFVNYISMKVGNILISYSSIIFSITSSWDNGWFFDFSNFDAVFLFFYFIFYFTILYWFCHTSTWIRHGCTCVPHPVPPFHLPPRTIPLGHPSAPAPSILYPASNLDWRFISYMIL